MARLYAVETRVLNQAVRRNRERFPGDFILELKNQEVTALRSQSVILKLGRGEHRKYAPLAFTEHGAIMAASILNSARAVQMNVYGVRAFVKMRESLLVNAVLAREVTALKSRVDTLRPDTHFSQSRRTDEICRADQSLRYVSLPWHGTASGNSG